MYLADSNPVFGPNPGTMSPNRFAAIWVNGLEYVWFTAAFLAVWGKMWGLIFVRRWSADSQRRVSSIIQRKIILSAEVISKLCPELVEGDDFSLANSNRGYPD